LYFFSYIGKRDCGNIGEIPDYGMLSDEITACLVLTGEKEKKS